jgi:flagellar L-ring protein precursor FlgH
MSALSLIGTRAPRLQSAPRWLLLAPALLLFWGCSVPHIDAYVPKQRNYDAVASKNQAQAADASGGLWTPDARNAALYSDYRAFREQDLVVVRVEEMADARRSADTNLSRESELSVALQAFLRAAGTQVNTTPQLDVTASAKSGIDFAGEGRTGRTERLTATVPAIVKKVLPNGNLFIEGHRVVLVNSEEQHFYISGVVRPIDIAQDNSVRSSYVADAEIEFTGRGVLSDNQKPGLLTRFFNWIWPF